MGSVRTANKGPLYRACYIRASDFLFQYIRLGVQRERALLEHIKEGDQIRASRLTVETGGVSLVTVIFIYSVLVFIAVFVCFFVYSENSSVDSALHKYMMPQTPLNNCLNTGYETVKL